MAKNKTTETNDSVADFINAVPDEQKQRDSWRLIEIMTEQTGFAPKMWGPSIIGFGIYHYVYESGHSGNAPMVGFSPRANAISLYCAGFEGRDEFLATFGKHKTKKGCIYVKKLSDISEDILRVLITRSVKEIKQRYPG